MRHLALDLLHAQWRHPVGGWRHGLELTSLGLVPVQERLEANLARIKDLRESAMQSAAPGESDASADSA